MTKSVLVAVHPAYMYNGELRVEKYGNYDAYVSRLLEAMRSQRSILFQYKQEAVPVKLLCSAECVVHDEKGDCKNVQELVSLLRKKQFDEIKLCGELVWWSGIEVVAGLKSALKKCLPEKRIWAEEFLKVYVSSINASGGMTKVRDGCVTCAYHSLLYAFGIIDSNVRVTFESELCYPTIEATKTCFAGMPPSHRYDFFLKAR